MLGHRTTEPARGTGIAQPEAPYGVANQQVLYDSTTRLRLRHKKASKQTATASAIPTTGTRPSAPTIPATESSMNLDLPKSHPAEFLFQHAIPNSIPNIESTLYFYGLLRATYQKYLNDESRYDREDFQHDVNQVLAHRCKLAIRGKKLLEQVKGDRVDGHLVNRMVEVAFTENVVEIAEASPYYWDKIQEAHARLLSGTLREYEAANLKVLFDCQRILHERHLALMSPPQ